MYSSLSLHPYLYICQFVRFKIDQKWKEHINFTQQHALLRSNRNQRHFVVHSQGWTSDAPNTLQWPLRTQPWPSYMWSSPTRMPRPRPDAHPQLRWMSILWFGLFEAVLCASVSNKSSSVRVKDWNSAVMSRNRCFPHKLVDSSNLPHTFCWNYHNMGTSFSLWTSKWIHYNF